MQKQHVLTLKRRWFEDAEVGTVWAVRLRKEKKVREKLPDSKERKPVTLNGTTDEIRSLVTAYKFTLAQNETGFSNSPNAFHGFCLISTYGVLHKFSLPNPWNAVDK